MTTTQPPRQMRLTERAVPVSLAAVRHAITMLTLRASVVEKRAPTMARDCLKAADALKADLEMAERAPE